MEKKTTKKTKTSKPDDQLSIERIDKILSNYKYDDKIGKHLLAHAYRLMNKKALGGILDLGLQLAPALINEYQDSLKESTNLIDPAYIDNSAFFATGGDLPEISVSASKMEEGGGIHIKESKKGTFTAAAKRRGMGVQEFASKVMANKDNYSATMVKKANFAKNASKWKHGMGDTFNSMSAFGNGGDLYREDQEFKEYDFLPHEEGGGYIDSNLNPTTNQPIAELEKNETSYKTNEQAPYIYSDELKDPETNMTFAEISKKINRRYRRGTDIDKVTKDLELKDLATKNDIAKFVVQEFQNGRTMPKYAPGGSINPDIMFNMASELFPFLNDIADYNYEKQVSEAPPVYTEWDAVDPWLGVKRANENFTSVEKLPTRTFTPKAQGFQSTASLPSRNFTAKSSADISHMADLKGALDKAKPKKRVSKTSPFDFNTAAIASKAVAFGANLIDSLQEPEKEKLQLNPYEQDVISLMEGRNIDLTPALNEITLASNAAMEDARNVAGNVGQFASLANKVYSNAGRSSAGVRMQEGQLRNQYRAEEAATKAQLGTERRGEMIRKQTADSQNEAQQRNLFRKVMSDLSQIGSEFNKFQYTKDLIANKKDISNKVIKEGLTILGNKHTDFGLSDDFMEKIQESVDNNTPLSIGDMIIFMNAVQNAEKNGK